VKNKSIKDMTLTDLAAVRLRQEFRCVAMAKKLGLKIRTNMNDLMDSLGKPELEQLADESRRIKECKTREARRELVAASPAFQRHADAFRVGVWKGRVRIAEFISMDHVEAYLAEKME
jgi:hypothetical protein